MFERLFAEAGLSLDRLRALVEVGAAGSIVRAAGQDTVRQSQYSRQIKELEEFFQAGLVERHGKGIRLTASGRELARISRFFLLGLANFQRGCLTEGQTYRLGAGPTFLSGLLLPLLARPGSLEPAIRMSLEAVMGEEVERRLHELTLDFGVVNREPLSRPLKLEPLGSWQLELWVPARFCGSEKAALRMFHEHRLPLAWPSGELQVSDCPELAQVDPALRCESFLQVRQAIEHEAFATVLPEFLQPEKPARFIRIPLPKPGNPQLSYFLAWNPRLLRLNPHAARRRDRLVSALRKLA